MKITIDHLPGSKEVEVVIRGQADSEDVQTLVALLSGTEPEKTLRSIISRQDEKEYVLLAEDIEQFYSKSGGTIAVSGGKPYRVRMTLSELELRMGAHGFRRISKSTVINCRAIKYLTLEFSGNYIIVTKSGAKLLLSRNYVPSVKQFIKEEM